MNTPIPRYLPLGLVLGALLTASASGQGVIVVDPLVSDETARPRWPLLQFLARSSRGRARWPLLANTR